MRISRRQIVAALPSAAFAGPAFAQSRLTTVKIWFNVFIPGDLGCLTLPAPGNNQKTVIADPRRPGVTILTDNRGFDLSLAAPSRRQSLATINVASAAIVSQTDRSSSMDQFDPSGRGTTCAAPAPGLASFSNARKTPEGLVSVDLLGAVINPCGHDSPAINYSGAFKIDPAGRTVAFDGLIEPFPAFEAYAAASGAAVMIFQAGPGTTATLGDLPDPPTVAVHGKAQL